MKNQILLIMLVLYSAQIVAQENSIWKNVSLESVKQSNKSRKASYSNLQKFYTLDNDKLKLFLLKSQSKFSGGAGVVIEIPTTNDGLEKFEVWENSNFAPELQAKYPNIKSYTGRSIKEKSTTINFSLSPRGIQTMILRADYSSEFIEPIEIESQLYMVFDSKNRASNKLPFVCNTPDKVFHQDLENVANRNSMANNKSYKTLRLALSCTGEYGRYFGGVSRALEAMNATMTRVNGVYERDMAVHFNIIANNDLIVYDNPNSDPYSNGSIGTGGAWNQELQTNLTNVLGNEAYDIGHLLAATGGGGNAGCIGCICDDDDGLNQETKGSAYSSPSDGVPEGDTFDIDYVCHEIGHQLGANHTFSYSAEGSGVQVEPGSGSTIMGYAGITDYNVQSFSDPYFAYRSILQMQNNLDRRSCPVSLTVSNSPPKVNAGADFIVPAGTAYILKGTASDIEGDALTYCWEQNNSASGTQDGPDSRASLTKSTGPVFRSFLPKTTPDRYLPEYSRVLAGTLSTSWESVSNVARSLRFTLTVRDNNPIGSQTETDEVIVTSRVAFNPTSASSGAGPFKVTSQNSSTISWNTGTAQTITWDVNNTTSLPGSSTVNIKLSIDGGLTFPYTLASGIPNDGNEVITVPLIPASNNSRILIEPTGNFYYAVNSKGFKIISTLASQDFGLSNFSLYPNPNKGSFTVQFDSISAQEIGVLVHDLRGRTVFEKKYNNYGLFSQNIQLDAIQKGVYLVTIKDGEQKVIKKIVVE